MLDGSCYSIQLYGELAVHVERCAVDSIDTFQTQRMIAERLRETDLGLLRRMHRDPKVMETLGGVRSEAQTLEFLEQNLSHWDEYGYGLWVFRTKKDGRFVGRGGLRNVRMGDSTEVELAYALMAEFWGLGLATEMAQAILTIAFTRLGRTSVIAFSLPSNGASRRVMDKVGCRFERGTTRAGIPHVLYRVTYSQYLSQKDSRTPR